VDNKISYNVNLKTSSASPERGSVIKMILNDVTGKINLAKYSMDVPLARLDEQIVEGRKYQTIDFILPGQLGFSLLSAGIFGTAFIFISLRQTLVLKRFFATPVKRIYIYSVNLSADYFLFDERGSYHCHGIFHFRVHARKRICPIPLI